MVSLFTLAENADLDTFFTYGDFAMDHIAKYDGFQSAFGYLSVYELAKYRYVGLTEFDSLEAVFEMMEKTALVTRLTPPNEIAPMTFFATCNDNTYPGFEHRTNSESSVTLIHPFSISTQERDGTKFNELLRRNLMAINGVKGHIGSRGYWATNSASIYNFTSVSEWESEEEFLAYRSSHEYKGANTGAAELVESGYPTLYRLMQARTSDGLRLDIKTRTAQ